jgi:stage II sporulation protein D
MKALLHVAVLLALGAGAVHAQNKDKDVRIGVLGLFHAKRIMVASIPGEPLQCKLGSAPLLLSSPISLELSGAKLKIADADNVASAFTCDNGTGSATGFVVSIPGKISRRYFGKLEITPESHELLIVVVMAIETAVASIVAAESPPHAPMEALKAQAVATRSFLLAGKGRHYGFDFCDTTHCQFLREPPGAKTAAFQAAAETSGLVLSYKSEVFAAMYSRSCSGRTHALDELGIPVRGYPYFSVACSYCQRHPEKWVAKIGSADATNLAPTESARLQLVRKLGWKAVPSNSYSSRTEGGAVILEGVGVGHGVGLCQRGGADMARQGAAFQQILEHYYPNTEVKQY